MVLRKVLRHDKDALLSTCNDLYMWLIDENAINEDYDNGNTSFPTLVEY